MCSGKERLNNWSGWNVPCALKPLEELQFTAVRRDTSFVRWDDRLIRGCNELHLYDNYINLGNVSLIIKSVLILRVMKVWIDTRNIKIFLLWLRNILISGGLEPVLTHNRIVFSTNNKIKIIELLQILLARAFRRSRPKKNWNELNFFYNPRKAVYNTMP